MEDTKLKMKYNLSEVLSRRANSLQLLLPMLKVKMKVNVHWTKNTTSLLSHLTSLELMFNIPIAR